MERVIHCDRVRVIAPMSLPFNDIVIETIAMSRDIRTSIISTSMIYCMYATEYYSELLNEPI